MIDVLRPTPLSSMSAWATLPYFRDTEWQPGGNVIATEAIPHKGTTFPTKTDVRYQLRFYSSSGRPQVVDSHSRPPEPEWGRRLSWSPNGERLAYVRRGSSTIRFYSPNGALTDSLSFAGRPIYSLTFTPDGAHLLVNSCSRERSSFHRCTMHLLLAPDPDADVDPAEKRDRRIFPQMDGPVPQIDVQPSKPPIIFVHGFLGSEMGCRGADGRPRVLWPTQRVRGALDQLRLNREGTENAAGTCGASPTRLLTEVQPLPLLPFKAPVYGSTMRQLRDLMRDPNDPGGANLVHDFAWDWRKDPRVQLGRLRTLVTQLSNQSNLRPPGVVLVGHSFGGLFIRSALNDPRIAKNVRRVLTLGTPYLGSPKAVLPLLAGVERPGGGGPLDRFLLIATEVQRMSRNSTGNYILYPHPRYGVWLEENDRPISNQQVDDFVTSLHGSPLAYNRALNFQESVEGFMRLDHLGPLREYRVAVGGGLRTIARIDVRNNRTRARISYISGDGTVPLLSAKQTPPGAGAPIGESVPIIYFCGIEHTGLVQKKRVFDVLGDYIRYGSPPTKTEPCAGRAPVFEEVALGGVAGNIPLAIRPRAASRMSFAPLADRTLAIVAEVRLGGRLEVTRRPQQPAIGTHAGRTGSQSAAILGWLGPFLFLMTSAAAALFRWSDDIYRLLGRR